MGYYDSMNLYQYCFNDPVNWVDPYGLWGVNIPGVGFQFPDFGKPQINNIGEIGLPDFNPYPNDSVNENGKCSGSKVKSDKGDKVGGKKEPKPGKRHGNKGGPPLIPGRGNPPIGGDFDPPFGGWEPDGVTPGT